jgi:hypothetical protein
MNMVAAGNAAWNMFYALERTIRAPASAYLVLPQLRRTRSPSPRSPPPPTTSILGDEAMHWAVLRQALGQNPAPDAFVS